MSKNRKILRKILSLHCTNNDNECGLYYMNNKINKFLNYFLNLKIDTKICKVYVLNL